MKYRSFLLLLVLCITSWSLPSFAVDVAYSGYFRARGNYFYNLDLDREQNPNSRAFTDFRFRLNPDFIVTDKFRVRTSLNFFDGVLGSHPFRSSAYNNPASSYNRHIDPSEAEAADHAGRSNSASTTSPYGGAYAPDGLVQSADLTPLYLRRVWGEFDFPYGTLKVGRMPFNLGMGIYANAGDEPDQDIGMSRDRIVFDTAFGQYYVRPGIGWLIEGALDQSADDFIEYFFLFGRKNEEQDISIYLSYNNQSNNRSSVTSTTSPLYDRGTHYWSFDFYAQNQFNLLNLMGEVALFNGRVMGKELLAVNAAARGDWNFNPVYFLTEVGFSSGTDAGDAASGDLKTVSFSRDYNVGLILFEEAIPGGATLKNSAGAADSIATAPHSGAISNALYGRMRLGYDVAPFFQPYLNVLLPIAAKTPVGSTSKFYGVEYDIITKWPINHYFTADLSFGQFIPGDLYNSISKTHSALLFRGGITAKF